MISELERNPRWLTVKESLSCHQVLQMLQQSFLMYPDHC